MGRTLILGIVLVILLGGCTGARLACGIDGCEPPAPQPCDEPVLTRSARCCEPCRIGCWPETPCRSTYVDASLSFLPNVGAGLGGGWVVGRTAEATTSLEILGTWQFLDDEDFVDDGNPAAGDWYQLRAGAKWSFQPKSRRHLTLRAGALWLQANGEPNILDEPGDWFGVYAGVGFETDLTPCVTVGPELALFLVTQDDEIDIEPVPQFNWHVTFWTNGGGTSLPRAPLGEIYAGGAVLVSPGFGGALQLGQVFAREPEATWSFEVMAGLQDAADTLWFEEAGNYGQIRGGVKATLSPCCRSHWTARAGAAWLRTTAANGFLDQTGDYVGVYAGVGYEWDVSARVSTGPELTLYLISREGDFEIEAVPQLAWHVLAKF